MHILTVEDRCSTRAVAKSPEIRCARSAWEAFEFMDIVWPFKKRGAQADVILLDRISPIGCGWPISPTFRRGPASSIWRSYSIDEIGCLTRPIPHARDGALATADADQASVPHQSGNAFATDANASFHKVNPVSWRGQVLGLGYLVSTLRAPRGFPRSTRRPSGHAQRSAA
jgi:hypothetical protein